jgi:hypothetical protein
MGQSLSIGGTEITDEGCRKLMKSLPALEIVAPRNVGA